MGLNSDYWAYVEAKNKRKKKEQEEASAKVNNKKTFQGTMLQELNKRNLAPLPDDIAPVRTTDTTKKKYEDDIAPIRSKKENISSLTKSAINNHKKMRNKSMRDYFTKGAFEDGYDKKDLSKTILGSQGDLIENIHTGIADMPEKIIDGLAQLAPYISQAQFNQNGGYYNLEASKIQNDAVNEMKKGAAEFVAKDLYDAEKVGKKVSPFLSPAALVSHVGSKILGVENYDDVSVFGEKADALAQSAGQLMATSALSATGVPWWLVSGATSFGGQAEAALNEGASFDEATFSAAVTAGAEVLSEKISGGIKFGGKTLDDALTKKLARGISNKTIRTLAKFGLDGAGESFEELVSGVMSNLGTAIYKEEDVSDILFNEDAVQEYIDGAVGGFLLGGGSSVGKAIKGKVTGIDPVTELTKSEQAVVDKVYNDEVAKAEKDGKKLSGKEKSKIYDEVLNKLEKGYIDIDTIESVLGGETYNKHKKTADSEDAIQNEFNALNKMKQSDMTGEQLDRRAELKQQLEEIKSKSQRSQLKSQLSVEVLGLVKGSKLTESYNEKARRSEHFEADLSQYDEKQRETVKKAIDSGILNNTNRTREFVDMLAKISADKGVLFDFTNNEKLKNSSFAVEGKTVNGYKTDDGNVALNIDSAKSLNSVVGHEITHILEGTELYSTLQEVAKQYATAKGEYGDRMIRLRELYTGVYKGEDFDARLREELTADIVGDYLFTDSDFINNLSTEQPGLFKKIYNEIKYLCKVATAGSKEARALEKVKRAFEQAYKESGTAQKGIQYTIDNNQNLMYNEGRGERYARTDEFKNLQAESQRMSYEDTQAYWSGSRKIDDEVRGRLSRTFGLELRPTNSKRVLGVRTLLNPKTNNNVNIVEGVDASLFRDVFEISRKYLRNGELVDLHDIETTEDHGIGYKYCDNYLSEDGLSGFSITPDGDLISVFNLNTERGFLKTIAPIVKEKANTLDCYASQNQNLMVMYEKIFGFKTASVMDYNMEYDHDNIAENHNEPKVAFMVNTESDVEVRYFTKEKYDEAVEYRNSFVNQAGSNESASSIGEKYSLGNDYVKTNSKAVMTDKRIDYLIEDSGAGSRQDYANYWITSISPTDFINLTTTEKTQDRAFFDEWGSEWNPESNMSTYDYMGELKKNMRQTPYLAIDINTGEVVGHEGRHRMRALEQNGITSAEIRVEFRDEDGRIIKYSPDGKRLQIKDAMQLINQFGTKQTATIENIIPLNKDYRSEILSNYGEKTAQENDIRYSLSKQGSQPTKQGNYNVTGEDIRFTDDIAPVRKDVAPVKAVEAKKLVAESDIAPVKKTETNKPAAEAKVAKILTKEPESNKRKRSAWSMFKTSFIDKASPFETLSLKTGNREVDAKFNSIRYADRKAQNLIGKGAKGVKALNDIQAEVEEKGLTQALYEYLYHMHNVDRMTLADRFEDVPNKAVFGDSVTARESQAIVSQYEKTQPKLKQYAQDIYNYNKYLRNLLVENGVISKETADLWEKMYPHFVPIRRADDGGLNINVPLDSRRTGINAPVKKAKGGNTDILPLFDTMAQRTLQTYKAIAKNRFGIELKNTLGTTIEKAETSLDEVIDGIETHEDLLQKGKNGKNPTFTVFENGEKVTFEITDEMYDAMKPTSEKLAYTSKVANKISNAMRGVLTEYSPTFMVGNAIKDAQDVLLNSQHPLKTYKNFAKASKELASKGKWYTEYMENGGEENTYFDKETNTFNKEKSELAKVIGFPLEKISEANNFIEKIPRLAEYIASRETGRSIDVSMLDAARVTTNFSAGGDVTKFLNRNGATFLNASVQGAAQQVRNVREAKANGIKGWIHLASKVALAGLPALFLNGLLWDDDEDYEELSDYVKQNYYVVAKFSDGKFVRIPKGRTMAVIQDAFTQVQNALTGDDEVDLQSFLDLAFTNLAPNNPIDNNILAPIAQVWENKTWYGEDLVPTRLQDVPAAEQYDESTDIISKWLGEKLNYSPYKINYLLNQYSGGVGDILLPIATPKAESEGGLPFIAPLRDKFTTDSVLKNQNTTDFYNVRDELTVNANSINATDEDVLKSKYFNSVGTEIGELYKEKREIQNSDLSDELKFKQVRDIQKQINEIAENALNTYENVNINGKYANIGDKHYRLDDEDKWQKITDEQLEKQNEVIGILGITPSQYWSNKAEYDMKAFYPEKYAVLQEQGISVEDYKENYEEMAHFYTDDYSWASQNPEKYTLSKAITSDVAEYKQYTSDLGSLEADKDSNGKSISGSLKAKKKAYIWGLDIDEGAKYILFKSQYKADNTYNREIVSYLYNKEDVSWSEMMTILEELDFKVESNGRISW